MEEIIKTFLDSGLRRNDDITVFAFLRGFAASRGKEN